MVWPEASALMPFIGSCRNQAPHLFSALASVVDTDLWRQSTFADAFCGGGANSLMAKQYGFRVLANDLAERSRITAAAIIEPDRFAVDLDRLLTPAPAGLVTEHLRDYFHRQAALFLDTLAANARTDQDRYLLLRAVLALKGGMYFSRLTTDQAEKQAAKATRETLTKLVTSIQAGVFPNGHRNQASRMDARTFLKGQPGALVASLDPPTYGNGAYERNYWLLDSILAGTVKKPARSKWTWGQAVQFFASVLQAAAHVPVWLVRHEETLISADVIEDLIRIHKPHVKRVTVPKDAGLPAIIYVASDQAQYGAPRPWVHLGDRPNTKAKPTREDRIALARDWLAEHETAALRYWVEPDWRSLQPTLVECKDPDLRAVWGYWRYMISSEPQSRATGGIGRETRYMVLDATGGGILGVFLLADAPIGQPWRDAYLGWANDRDSPKWATINSLIHLARCLPVAPFGRLLGGKLLASMATAREVVRRWELRYSVTALALTVPTTHGRSSQYNRLDGFEFCEGPDGARSGYIVELRAKGIRALKGEVPVAKTRGKTKPLNEVVGEWRERWYLPRLEREPIPEWDPRLYTLARQLSGS